MSDPVVRVEIHLNFPSNTIRKRQRCIEEDCVGVLPKKKCGDKIQWDYVYVVHPIIKALKIFDSLMVNGILNEYDRRELQHIRCDAENLIKEITNDPSLLLNEIVHRNRMTLHNRILAFSIKYNVDIEQIALHCQILWRLNFKLDILRFNKIRKRKCMELYPDLIVDQELFTGISKIDNDEGIKSIANNGKFISAVNLLCRNKELIKPRYHIPERDTNDNVDLSVDQCRLLNAIQNAREIVKQLLIRVWKLHSSNKITLEQTKKHMELFETVIETVLNQDKMLSLFYLFPIRDELKQLGIPWAMKDMSNEYQFIIDYINDYHKSLFSISKNTRDIITNYFPHLIHHLMPCLPAHFNPQNTEKTQWKKMYFRVADVSWRMFWAAHADTTLLNVETANKKPNSDVGTTPTEKSN